MSAAKEAPTSGSDAPVDEVVEVQGTVAPPRSDSAENEVFFVSVSFRGTTYEVPVQLDDAVCSIFEFVHEVLDVPQENCKLIFRGKVLRLNDAAQTVGDVGLTRGAKLMLVATSAHDVAFVRTSRADPLVKGFVEEERDERSRRKRARAAEGSLWGTKQDSEFRFGSIKAEFKYSSPSPYEAEKLLQRLATDPGIIEIMKTRRFKVGVFTEMSPLEAQERMAKRGTPNMDLLGYNMNSGDMIVLRLRTDNVKGFRPYHDLINTLIHELTHNVWGPHDHNFWKLFGELKAQYMRFHRFWSHGGKAADSGASGGQFTGFASGDNDEGGGDEGFGKVLGGATEEREGLISESVRRERALLAAEARKVGASPKPNFLTGGGKWVIVCPCGQVHDSTDCPFGGPASADSLQANAEVTDEATTLLPVVDSSDVHVAKNDDAVAVGDSIAQFVASTSSAPGQDGAEAFASEPATAFPIEKNSHHTEKTLIADAAVDAADVVVDTVAVQPIVNNVGKLKSCSAGGELVHDASVAAPVMSPPATPPFDFPFLGDLGMDGTTEWLQRFSGEVQTLRRGSSGSATRVAVEMLLRIVRNVVSRPQEPRYRRIRADNPRVRKDFLDVVGEHADSLMASLGFHTTVEAGEKVFVLRDAFFDCARLRMGQEVLEMELANSCVAAH